jgi:peptidoglycan hydrolase-like protein with peptidoglycan-binding domain
MMFRSKLWPFAFIASVIAFEFLAMTHVSAQTNVAPAAAPAADPALEVSKRAFEALSDAERIAIQDGLIWTGDYKGVADGKFGKGTRDAIIAFASRAKFPTDGTLDAKARMALAATAKQVKDAVRFLVQTDAKTGIRVGLPMQILTKAKPSGTGTRYSSTDDSFWVETMTRPADAAKPQSAIADQPVAKWPTPAASATALQDLYASIIADQPGRKVTYKVSRPDFFVVTGQTATNTFYTRVALGMHGGNYALHGFTVTYPLAAKARFDAITIAIANSFVPFPETFAAVIPPTAVQTTPVVQGMPAPVPANPAATRTDAGARPSSILASGIVVAPGFILTSLPKACADPSIRTKKAKIVKQAEADGLTLLSLPDAPAATLSLRASDPKSATDVVVLSFTSQAANDAGAGDELIGASGILHELEPAGIWRLQAAVQNPVAGAAVFDRSGALAGLIPTDANPVKSIAGILPEMNRNVIPASKLLAFLAEAKPKSAEHSELQTTGEIVARGRTAMVSISCSH